MMNLQASNERQYSKISSNEIREFMHELQTCNYEQH